eukprot:CAMPEP_0181220262 /NCGR_PEP_ID=MMETSP1096-20121128/28742_1 /TAXON_ID=156174 ORGANISM="Chrysochromulina ericina, Strain CCMP281" /NCGR_SAMPLE_ID=MMETSP1096 /ASSEMBLY_ACC=CAM_ASM_000453 /LENGTH=119 /DNA_ID=CAMNT_0023312751 /DNA_START=69 /DNA_END=428 /DNA_ORIENTATION=+
MTLNALFGTVLANMLLARAMLLASPLIATVGLSLSIPLAMLSDIVRQRAQFTSGVLTGTVAVWIGFIAVSAADHIEKYLTAQAPSCFLAARIKTRGHGGVPVRVTRGDTGGARGKSGGK